MSKEERIILWMLGLAAVAFLAWKFVPRVVPSAPTVVGDVSTATQTVSDWAPVYTSLNMPASRDGTYFGPPINNFLMPTRDIGNRQTAFGGCDGC